MIVTQGWLDRLVMDAYGNLIWKPRHALLCQRGFSCSLLLHKSSGSSASKRISLDVATTATGRGECGWVLFSGGGEYVFRCQGGVAERDAWVDAVARVVGQSGVGRVMDEMAGGEGVVELERPVRRMPMVSMDVERMFEDLFVQLDVAKREHDPNTAAASKTGGVNIRRTKSSGDMVTAASAAWKGEVVANDIRRAGSAAGVQKDLPTFPPDLRESAVETSGRPSTDSRRHSATCPTDDRTSNSLSPSSFDAIRRPSESSPATVASGSRRPSATTTETDDHLGVASEFRRPSNLSSASGSRRPSNMTDRTYVSAIDSTEVDSRRLSASTLVVGSEEGGSSRRPSATDSQPDGAGRPSVDDNQPNVISPGWRLLAETPSAPIASPDLPTAAPPVQSRSGSAKTTLAPKPSDSPAITSQMDSRARSATTTAAPFYLRPTDLAAGERTPRTKLDVDLMFKDLFDELEAARLEHDPAAESGDAGQNGEHFAHGAAVVTPGSAITRRPSKATVPNIRRAKSSAAVLTVGTSTRAVAMGSTPAPVVKGQFPSPRHSNEPGDQPLASSEPGLRIDADGLPGSQSARTPSPPMNESLSWSATATPILPASTILSRGRSTTTTAALTTNCRPSDINLLTSRSRSATTTAEPDPSALVNVSAMDLMDFYTPALTTVTAKRLTPNLRITTTLASITNLKFARPVNATPPVRDVTAPGGPINVPSRGSSLAPVDPPQGPSFAAAIGRPRAATDAAAPDQSTRWIRARAFTVSEDSIGACGAGKAAVRAATTTTTETSAGAVGVRPFDLSAAAGEFVSARPRQGVAGLQLRVGRIGGRLGRAGGR